MAEAGKCWRGRSCRPSTRARGWPYLARLSAYPRLPTHGPLLDPERVAARSAGVHHTRSSAPPRARRTARRGLSCAYELAVTVWCDAPRPAATAGIDGRECLRGHSPAVARGSARRARAPACGISRQARVAGPLGAPRTRGPSAMRAAWRAVSALRSALSVPRARTVLRSLIAWNRRCTRLLAQRCPRHFRLLARAPDRCFDPVVGPGCEILPLNVCRMASLRGQ